MKNQMANQSETWRFFNRTNSTEVLNSLSILLFRSFHISIILNSKKKETDRSVTTVVHMCLFDDAEIEQPRMCDRFRKMKMKKARRRSVQWGQTISDVIDFTQTILWSFFFSFRHVLIN